jgi:hypothetical protein
VQATHPLWWIPQPDNAAEPWALRQMTHVGPMRWDWPVEINYLEAKAFCTWKSNLTGKSIRLPTEEECMFFSSEVFFFMPVETVASCSLFSIITFSIPSRGCVASACHARGSRSALLGCGTRQHQPGTLCVLDPD